jgi:hypothetical protein
MSGLPEETVRAPGTIVTDYARLLPSAALPAQEINLYEVPSGIRSGRPLNPRLGTAVQCPL